MHPSYIHLYAVHFISGSDPVLVEGTLVIWLDGRWLEAEFIDGTSGSIDGIARVEVRKHSACCHGRRQDCHKNGSAKLHGCVCYLVVCVECGKFDGLLVFVYFCSGMDKIINAKKRSIGGLARFYT